jgi:site-specific recombinase XerD
VKELKKDKKDTKSKMKDKKRDMQEGSVMKRKISVIKDHFEHLGLEGYNGDEREYNLKRIRSSTKIEVFQHQEFKRGKIKVCE